jgi:hypothetical protein
VRVHWCSFEAQGVTRLCVLVGLCVLTPGSTKGSGAGVSHDQALVILSTVFLVSLWPVGLQRVLRSNPAVVHPWFAVVFTASSSVVAVVSKPLLWETHLDASPSRWDILQAV